MSPSAVARYRKSQVTTQDAPGILLALLDGLERFLQSALEDYGAGRWAAGHESCSRGRAIVDELFASLDRERAPQLCEQLGSLYLFASGRLLDSIITKSPTGVEEAMRTLAPIMDAFRQAVPIARAEAEAAQPRVVNR